jgi:hypothetical protein
MISQQMFQINTPCRGGPKRDGKAWTKIGNMEDKVKNACAINVHQYHQAHTTPFAMVLLSTYLVMMLMLLALPIYCK